MGVDGIQFTDNLLVLMVHSVHIVKLTDRLEESEAQTTQSRTHIDR
jgi:hypothetical protein